MALMCCSTQAQVFIIMQVFHLKLMQFKLVTLSPVINHTSSYLFYSLNTIEKLHLLCVHLTLRTGLREFELDPVCSACFRLVLTGAF